MNYDQWVETFRPINNPLYADRGYDGKMFETFGEELAMVKASPDPKTIWTLLDEDGHTWIAAGWHYVNRMGYFVTEVPFTDEQSDLEIALHGPDEDLPDSEAMIAIQEIMSGKEWTPDTLNEIADVMRRAGYNVDDVSDDEDESRCRTEGCTEDANDGEGFDGYCGNCADRREANGEGIES